MSDRLALLQKANPELNILPITDISFERYGQLLNGFDPAEMIQRSLAACPGSQATEYEPSVSLLEAPCAFNQAMIEQIYGGMPIQVGWCYGKNNRLGALEYHKGNEVNVCITDMVLLVGHVQDIIWGETISYDTAQVKAFYAPAGTVVELPAWNLHYAPIQITSSEEFISLVYLPKGTNTELSFSPAKQGEAQLLFAVNKWLLAHPDDEALTEAKAYPGLSGNDIVVNLI